MQKTLAWSVHFFTASGLLTGFMAILAINEKEWRSAMFWLLASLVIDGIDGTFARLFRVREVLPYMDGKTIDYVIDFATYAIIPAYFFHEAGLVASNWQLPLTFLILLVSAVYYGKEGMVSPDNYFVGFPVLWNMVVFYLVFVCSFTPLWNGIMIVIFAALHFAPIKFAYPSQASRLKKITIAVSTIILIALPMMVYYYPVRPFWLQTIMVLNLFYFGGIAFYDTFIYKEKG
ncbi:MAG: phosphatidylcholine/phosphatidylserine synthase [Bacteroidota bacterium]